MPACRRLLWPASSHPNWIHFPNCGDRLLQMNEFHFSETVTWLYRNKETIIGWVAFISFGQRKLCYFSIMNDTIFCQVSTSPYAIIIASGIEDVWPQSDRRNQLCYYPFILSCIVDFCAVFCQVIIDKRPSVPPNPPKCLFWRLNLRLEKWTDYCKEVQCRLQRRRRVPLPPKSLVSTTRPSSVNLICTSERAITSELITNKLSTHSEIKESDKENPITIVGFCSVQQRSFVTVHMEHS